jgi:hypothetical protein
MGGDVTPRIRETEVPVLDFPFVICFLLYAIYVIFGTKSIKIMHTYMTLYCMNCTQFSSLQICANIRIFVNLAIV